MDKDESEGNTTSFLSKARWIKWIVSGAISMGTIGGGYWGYALYTKKAPFPWSCMHTGTTARKSLYYELPDIITNIASHKKVKLGITLELALGTNLKQFDTLKPHLIDQLQMFARGLCAKDLENGAHTTGYDWAGTHVRLREAIYARLKVITDPIKINDVLFRELTIQ
ncbi:MAG: flagellar basal body-associated FliL family protein [Holosporales bacterium]|jgi:flagellar basal body-associated protein FliL|nr:flagellar basal body-associated FliL family protein [Holosporales bacterium]